MIPLNLASIAQACGGTLSASATGEERITGKVEFDSRKIAQGDLFIALHGARVDGHDFADQVMDAGAAGALLYRDVGVPGVLVAKVEQSASNAYATAHDSTGAAASVIAGMSKLARYVCDQLTPQLCVVGVTGSAGKTSAKDMMASIFSAQAPTVAPPGSFNNEIGHPYTVLRCDTDTRFLVSELSARGVGHIRALTEVAPPHIGVVLNVGSAHLGEFGSQATIAKAKGELVEALPADGVAVLNADDPLVAAMASRTDAKVMTFGTAEDATVRASEIRLDAQARPAFRLHTPEGEAEIQLGVSGEHQVWNALAALAAALAAGVDLSTAVTAIQAHRNASAHRMDVRHRGDGLTVIDDAYNANAESMRAGIRAAVSTARGQQGRAIAVLGPMGELGQDSAQEHERLGTELAALGVDKLVVVGDQPDAQALARGAGSLTEAVTQTPEQAAGVVEKLAGPRDTVLVKASNAFQLWRVADALMANDAINEDHNAINKDQQELSELQVNDK